MITVHKRDHLGQEKIKYEGEVLERSLTRVILEARFALPTKDAGYVTFETGDRFIEYFYSNRWYNIFAMFRGSDGSFKGWYCNITRPAKLDEDAIWADDLALDLFVHPNGQQLVLDEDEFAELKLNKAEQKQARAALAELQKLASQNKEAFYEKGLEKFKR